MDKTQDNAIFQPSKKQLDYALILLDPEQRTTKTDIAKKIDVDSSTVWRWEQDIAFVKWLNSLAETTLQASFSERLTTAVRRAKNGDYNFARLLFEMEGKYTPTLKQDVNIKVTEIIISHVVEIVSKYVTDENIRKQIAEELCLINLN